MPAHDDDDDPVWQGPRISVDKAAAGDSGPEDDDNDTCEEWERHEALHDDVQANRTIGRQVGDDEMIQHM